ncbi:MAG TPA: glycosyltransferase family 2 protein [Planctomycetota bacterium]|nr:glycosyltransferase family 2 protein [Planctomycetota bacterium]
MKNLIVIPAYNEEQALPGTIAALQALPDGFEIVVINDGSRDGTAAAAQEAARASRLPVHLINMPSNGGIGVAVQAGYLFAARRGGFTYAIQFDADGQHDASYLQALVAECEAKHLDLCIGSRFLQKSEGNFQSTLTRRVGIRFFSRLIGLLSGVRVTDPTSGFRCAGPRAWKRFSERYPDDYPEPESLFWCARNKLNIGEIPVRMRERQGGITSIRYFRTIYYMVKVSLAIVIDRLRAREKI